MLLQTYPRGTRFLNPIVAQPAVPADRCAHETGGFLRNSTMRLRQLNGNPLGCLYA
jgi:hypothetical protein